MTPKSFKPEFLIDGVWYPNGVAFATEAEAKANAAHKFSRWTMPTDYRAVPSDEIPNYAWTDKGLAALEPVALAA